MRSGNRLGVFAVRLLPDTRLLPPPQQLTVVARIAAKREEAGIAEACVSNRSGSAAVFLALGGGEVLCIRKRNKLMTCAELCFSTTS